MEDRYFVSRDFQGGCFGMYRLFTIKDWKKQAIEWCEQDDNEELLEEIKGMEENEDLLETIAEIWTIELQRYIGTEEQIKLLEEREW